MTGRDVLPARVASARSRAAIRSARVVSCRIASAAFPVTGAMLAASCSRLASTCRPDSSARMAEAGWVPGSNGTPSGGQQPGLVHT